MISSPATSPNTPNLAGQYASKQILFGESSRYAVYAVHTRFESVCWVVVDAESSDSKNFLPEIIRQESSFDKAIEGLV